MKHFKFFLLIFVVLALTSSVAEAAKVPICTAFVYVNGVDTSSAKKDADLIADATNQTSLSNSWLPQFKSYLSSKGKLDSMCYPNSNDPGLPTGSSHIGPNDSGITYVWNPSDGNAAVDVLGESSRLVFMQNLTSLQTTLATPLNGRFATIKPGMTLSDIKAAEALMQPGELQTYYDLHAFTVRELGRNHKVVCIGHSEGNFFCNLEYAKLVVDSDGIMKQLGLKLPDASVYEVIGIGTPASYTADGRNEYITSSCDVIRVVQDLRVIADMWKFGSAVATTFFTNDPLKIGASIQAEQKNISVLPMSLSPNYQDTSGKNCGMIYAEVPTAVALFALNQWTTTPSMAMDMVNYMITTHSIATYLTPGSATQQRIFLMMERTLSAPLVLSSAIIQALAGNGTITSAQMQSGTSLANSIGESVNFDSPTVGTLVWQELDPLGGGLLYKWRMSRTFFPFDLSVQMPVDATIFYGSLCFSGLYNPGDGHVVIVGSNQPSSQILVKEDFSRVDKNLYSDSSTDSLLDLSKLFSPTMQKQGCIPLNGAGNALLSDAFARKVPVQFALQTLSDYNGAPEFLLHTNFGVGSISTVKSSDAGLRPVLKVVYLASSGLTSSPFTSHAAPILVLKSGSNVIFTQGSTFTDSGYTATDYKGSSLPVTVTGKVNTAVSGFYVLKYDTVDSDGYKTSAQRMVTVKPSATPVSYGPPTVTLIGSAAMLVQKNSVWSDPVATATSPKDGTVTSKVTVTSSPSPFTVATAGVYILTYSVTDSTGQSASATRTVTVVNNSTASTTVRCPVATGSGSIGSSAATFSTARNAQVGYVSGRSAISQDAKSEGANVWTDPGMTQWYVTRMFLLFDTRTCVPSYATVTDVTLRLSARSAPSASIATLTTSSQASPLALALTDFPKVGSVRLADDKDAAIFGTTPGVNGSSLWKLNPLGVAAFNKGGYTQLAVVTTRDFTNSQPVWPGPGIADITTYAATSADQPYLEVVYSSQTTGSIGISSNWSSGVSCVLDGLGVKQNVTVPTASPIDGFAFGTYTLSCTPPTNTTISITPAATQTLTASSQQFAFAVTVTPVAQPFGVSVSASTNTPQIGQSVTITATPSNAIGATTCQWDVTDPGITACQITTTFYEPGTNIVNLVASDGGGHLMSKVITFSVQGRATVYMNPIPYPTCNSNAWSITSSQAYINGTWMTQPVVTLCGNEYRWNHPAQYIEALKELHLLFGEIAQVDSIVAWFQQYYIPYWPAYDIVSPWYTVPVITSREIQGDGSAHAGKPFTMKITGSNYVKYLSQVWFYGQLSCVNGCQHPASGTIVVDPKTILLQNVTLSPADSFTIRIKNDVNGSWSAYGGLFNVIP